MCKVYVLDLENDERRLGTVKDVQTCARLIDGLDYITSSSGGIIWPQDVAPEIRPFVAAFETLKNSEKSGGVLTDHPKQDKWNEKYSAECVGGIEELKKTQICYGNIAPTSPLNYGEQACEKLYPFQKISCGSIEDEGWGPDLEELREKITDKTKGIVVVNPNNPTGVVYDEKTLREIVDIAGTHDIPLISDEIYDLTIFDGLKTISMASISGDVPCIVLNGMTKNYCVPGWRVGYMCFHDPEFKMEELKKRINNYIGYLISLMPTPIQAAAATSLNASLEHYEEYREYLTKMMNKLAERRDYTWKRLNEIEGISCVKSNASYFSFPRIEAIGKTWKDDNDFVMSVLEEVGVFLRPGFIFGEKYGVGHTRVTFLYSIDELRERYDRLEAFMKRHVN